MLLRAKASRAECGQSKADAQLPAKSNLVWKSCGVISNSESSASMGIESLLFLGTGRDYDDPTRAASKALVQGIGRKPRFKKQQPRNHNGSISGGEK